MANRHCLQCGVALKPGAQRCRACFALVADAAGPNGDEGLNDAARRSEQTERDRRIVRFMLVGVYVVSVVFALLGAVLVYLGAYEALQLSLFGQEMSSSGPGFAAMAVGAVLIATIGRRFIRHIRYW